MLTVMKALLEAGGRELLILTMHGGASCLSVARQANRTMACKVLETECKIAGLSSPEITIFKCG